MKSIVIIDDDVEASEMLRMLLGFQGHEVRCARSASAGIDLILAVKPNVIITDLGLSDVGAFDFIRALVIVIDDPKVQILVLTGSNELGQRGDALNAGAAYYFVKRDDIGKLLQVVGSI